MQNQVRIIGGKWRGRKIQFNDSLFLRPTSDRIRETVFNWLRSSIIDANCLDLFAGSGALSFEALSRGAAKVYAIDENKVAIQNLKNTAQHLNANDDIQIIQANSLEWLKEKLVNNFHLNNNGFDIIFLDPPYSKKLLIDSILLIQQGDWLKSHGYLYCESDVSLEQLGLFENPQVAYIFKDNFKIIKDKKAGNVYYYLIEKL